MFKFFRTSVTEETYREYVNTGFVPKRIITALAKKTIGGIELTSQEFAVFCGMTAEINAEILKLTKK